jgi:hypothetical protein
MKERKIMARQKKVADPTPSLATCKAEKAPSIAGVMNKVAAKVDTNGTSINVAETKRVIKTFVDCTKKCYPDPVKRLQFLMKNFL